MRKVSKNAFIALVLDKPNCVFAISAVLTLISSVLFSYSIGDLEVGSRLPLSSPSAEKEQEGYASSFDKARTAEALFHANPNASNALSLSHALLNAREYRTLADLLRREDQFPLDETVRAVFLSETDLRLQNFTGAFEAADALVKATPDHAEARYIRARARYALIGEMTDDVRADLIFVLKNNDTLAPAVWLFWARIAMDVNDLDDAVSAMKRAAELGVSSLSIDAIEIEVFLRRGDLEAARQRLQRRVRRLSQKGYGIDVEGERLTAMLDLALNDPLTASARLDRISFWLSSQIRGNLLKAIAKFEAGDKSQGVRLLEEYRVTAPEDWVVNDLYSEYINRNPLSGVGNRDGNNVRIGDVAQALQSNNLDRAVSNIEALTDSSLNRTKLKSARATLIGMPIVSEEQSHARIVELFQLEAEARSHKRYLPVRKSAQITKKDEAVKQYFAAKATLKAGKVNKAIQMYEQAASKATDFFAPVKELATHFAKRGQYIAGEDLVASYLRRNPDRPDARIWYAFYLGESGKQDAATSVFAGLTVEELFSDIAAVEAYGMALEPGSHALQELINNARRRLSKTNTLGHLLAHGMDNQGAARAFLSSIAVEPRNIEARQGYLAAMTALGRGKQAQKVLSGLDEKVLQKGQERTVSNQEGGDS